LACAQNDGDKAASKHGRAEHASKHGRAAILRGHFPQVMREWDKPAQGEFIDSRMVRGMFYFS
jgi:hypothetical protein